MELPRPPSIPYWRLVTRDRWLVQKLEEAVAKTHGFCFGLTKLEILDFLYGFILEEGLTFLYLKKDSTEPRASFLSANVI